MRRPLLLSVLAVLAAAAFSPSQSMRIGEIEFYGYAGLDPTAIRASLPVHEGDEFSEDEMPKLIEKLKQVTKAPSIATVCCDDRGNWMLYIPLPGKSVRNVPYNGAPEGTANLPKTIADLYGQFQDALMQAVQKGAGAEDDSKGYALTADPATRAKQLAMRDYAIAHESLLRRVLESSSDSGQRAVAAQLMGYTRQSRKQIDALVRASHDPDDTVRNNAVRALWVLAMSSPKMAAQIPASGFIEMLYSNSWSDRNKPSLLLEVLTRSRDPRMLREICAEAREPLLEMAGWRNIGHASAARLILGRCAGIEEARLQKLIETGALRPQ